ncbi:unnamed protein product [Mytilus coruscus]|uniref:DDE Tnp4 domain-containing protein n=1 Tax=Mytilus coruscus TaxID=42192 RepID=A0A6J8DJL5_MYTCO|nr:unnamed protein product [Mytilus coruscus]
MKKMSKIKHDHTELNKEVKKYEKIQTDANNNLQGISDFMDDFKVNHENNVKDVRSVKSSISKVANYLADNTLELRNEIKTVVNNAKQENEILQSTVIDLQCRSMKNNLVFTGLAETEGENTEEVIRIVIDNQKNICYVHSGFLGHNNDAFCYQQIRQIGPGLENDFPAHCFILADSIYPNAPPLVTPFKSTDIVRRPRLEQKRQRKFNLLHGKRRVYVEHVIKELKTFRVIGALYRHPRWEMSSIVELCTALAKRRADLIKDVYS